MHAVVARAKGFCDKYNFKCELKVLNSRVLGLQALVDKTIDVSQTGTLPAVQTVAAATSSLSAPAWQTTCWPSACATTCRCPTSPMATPPS